MDTLPKEILLEIINYSKDICDWINFMVSSKYIHKQIYPEFIYKKFKFVVFDHQTLSPCCRNKNTKYYVINSYPYYISTNEIHINGHCQYERIRFHETYGLLFQGLFLNEHTYLEIDLEKIFNIISDNIYENIYDKPIFNNYFSNITKPYIKYVNLIKSFIITKKFIKNCNNEFYEKNMLKVEKCFDRDIKFRSTQENRCIQNLKLEYPKTEFDTCIFCNTKYINDKPQFHKNWIITRNMYESQTSPKCIYDFDTEITTTGLKINPFYQPKNYISNMS
jgi:hypothetical protein